MKMTDNGRRTTEGIGQRTEKRHKNPHRTQDIGHRHTRAKDVPVKQKVHQIHQAHQIHQNSKLKGRRWGEGRGGGEARTSTYTTLYYTTL